MPCFPRLRGPEKKNLTGGAIRHKLGPPRNMLCVLGQNSFLLCATAHSQAHSNYHVVLANIGRSGRPARGKGRLPQVANIVLQPPFHAWTLPLCWGFKVSSITPNLGPHGVLHGGCSSAVNWGAKYCPSCLLNHSRDHFHPVKTGLSLHSAQRGERQGEMEGLLWALSKGPLHSVETSF